MDGSPSAIITMGLGAWGSVGLVVTLGYGSGDASIASSGLEATIPFSRLHAIIHASRLHATSGDRLHATVKDDP